MPAPAHADLLPKKGDLSDPNKWRGTSLPSAAASKLVSSVIATRLGSHFIDVGLDEQCGGVFGKGCIDGTYNVKQALHTLSLNTAMSPTSSSLTWSSPTTPSIASYCGRSWPGVDAQRTSSSSFVSSTCNRSSVMDWFRSISSGS